MLEDRFQRAETNIREVVLATELNDFMCGYFGTWKDVWTFTDRGICRQRYLPTAYVRVVLRYRQDRSDRERRTCVIARVAILCGLLRRKSTATMDTIVIIGAGGNALEVAGIIRDLKAFNFAGYVADRPGAHGDDQPTLGKFDWLDGRYSYIQCLAMGIGSPGAKLAVGDELKRQHPTLIWPTLIHPTAYVGGSARLSSGVIICVGAIVTENVSIGEFSQINFGAMVGHGATIGRGCLINPAANISGGVKIGDGVLVGTGARILEYLSVGDGATIGAGSVVTKNVEPGITVVGVPAKVLQKK